MIEMCGKKLTRQDRRSQDQDSTLHHALLSLRHDAACSAAASGRCVPIDKARNEQL
jgi:hypothetical protein